MPKIRNFRGFFAIIFKQSVVRLVFPILKILSFGMFSLMSYLKAELLNLSVKRLREISLSMLRISKYFERLEPILQLHMESCPIL